MLSTFLFRWFINGTICTKRTGGNRRLLETEKGRCAFFFFSFFFPLYFLSSCFILVCTTLQQMPCNHVSFHPGKATAFTTSCFSSFLLTSLHYFCSSYPIQTLDAVSFQNRLLLFISSFLPSQLFVHKQQTMQTRNKLLPSVMKKERISGLQISLLSV